MDKKTFGDNLKKIRQSKNVSRKELADLLKMNEVAFGSYERGENGMSLEKLFMVADYLKTPVSDFLGESAQTVNYAVFEYRLRPATKIIILCGCSLEYGNDGTIELLLPDEPSIKTVFIGDTDNPKTVLHLRNDSLTFKNEKNFLKVFEYWEDEAAEKNLPVKSLIKQSIDKANSHFEKSYRDNLKKHQDELKSKTEISVHWGDD